MPARRRNVLFIISSLSVGGAEKLLINLVNRFDPGRFAVDVVALSSRNPLAGELCADRVRFSALPRMSRYDIQPARQVRQMIVSNATDTVIAFDLFSYLYVKIALRNVPQRPGLLISLHATTPKSLKHFLHSMVYARLLSSDTRLISVCQAQADYFAKVYGIPHERFTTIYNGVDVERFQQTPTAERRNALRSAMGISPEAYVIVQVASLAPHKRHEDALMALKELMRRKPETPFRLLLVGQGSKERTEKLRTMAEALGLAEAVKFCGLQDDVRPYYEAGDLFTLSSQSIETFSVAALEAMSMGLPCVLTDVGGASEMIVEGMNGYLVPRRQPDALADAWLRVVENRRSFDPAAIRALVAERFNLVECVRQYEKLAG